MKSSQEAGNEIIVRLDDESELNTYYTVIKYIEKTGRILSTSDQDITIEEVSYKTNNVYPKTFNGTIKYKTEVDGYVVTNEAIINNTYSVFVDMNYEKIVDKASIVSGVELSESDVGSTVQFKEVINSKEVINDGEIKKINGNTVTIVTKKADLITIDIEKFIEEPIVKEWVEFKEETEVKIDGKTEIKTDIKSGLVNKVDGSSVEVYVWSDTQITKNIDINNIVSTPAVGSTVQFKEVVDREEVTKDGKVKEIYGDQVTLEISYSGEISLSELLGSDINITYKEENSSSDLKMEGTLVGVDAGKNQLTIMTEETSEKTIKKANYVNDPLIETTIEYKKGEETKTGTVTSVNGSEIKVAYRTGESYGTDIGIKLYKITTMDSTEKTEIANEEISVHVTSAVGIKIAEWRDEDGKCYVFDSDRAKQLEAEGKEVEIVTEDTSGIEVSHVHTWYNTAGINELKAEVHFAVPKNIKYFHFYASPNDFNNSDYTVSRECWVDKSADNTSVCEDQCFDKNLTHINYKIDTDAGEWKRIEVNLTRSCNAVASRYTTYCKTEVKLDVAVEYAKTWYGDYYYTNNIIKEETHETYKIENGEFSETLEQAGGMNSHFSYVDGGELKKSDEEILVYMPNMLTTYKPDGGVFETKQYEQDGNKVTEEIITKEADTTGAIFNYKSVEKYAWGEVGSRIERWWVSLDADDLGYWVFGGPVARNIHNKNDDDDGYNFSSEETLLNIRATYAIENGTNDRKAKRAYTVDKMTIKTTKYQVGYLFETVTTTLEKGTPTVVDKADIFLSLLKNSTGEYNSAAPYDPNGEEIRYKTVYNSEDRVARFFETSADMFFNLLESSPRTEGFVSVMKWILYQYTSRDYGVTKFSYDIINREGFENIYEGSQAF